MKRSLHLKKLWVFFVISGILLACTRVPFTGRNQVTGLFSTSDVLSMSYQSYGHVLDSVHLSDDEEQVAMVKRVGEKIQSAAEELLAESGSSSVLDGFEWDFNLIENDTVVNAWCMPGGKVAFYTAILPICKDETGLAVVMGHEVAHALAKHGQERINQGYIKQTGLSIGAAAIGQDANLAEQAIFYGIGYGSELGMLAFSRTHESEADEIGLYLMASAGYDPREAPAFWQRMSSGGGPKPPEFLSTHPSDETRIKKLNELMPKAMEYFEANQQ